MAEPMKTILRAVLPAAAILLWLCLSPVSAQVLNQRQGSSRGVASSQLTSGRVLSFSKGPGKRVLYAAGSQLKVQLLSGEKLSGRLQAVRDTDFIIGGRAVALDSLKAYYVPMRTCLIVGTALCVGGGGYMLLDGFNGLINGKQPAFHMEALAVGLPAIGAGAVLLPFREVKRKTAVWKPACLELW